MPAPDLVYRVTNYLQRQIAWSEETIGRLEAVEAEIARGDIDRLVAEERERQQRTQDFLREYRGLLHEWQRANDIDAADRAAVRKLSDRAQELNARLRARYTQAAEQMTRAAAGNREARDTLRRGHRMLTRYRPFHDEEKQGGLLDRNA